MFTLEWLPAERDVTRPRQSFELQQQLRPSSDQHNRAVYTPP